MNQYRFKIVNMSRLAQIFVRIPNLLKITTISTEQIYISYCYSTEKQQQKQLVANFKNQNSNVYPNLSLLYNHV